MMKRIFITKESFEYSMNYCKSENNIKRTSICGGSFTIFAQGINYILRFGSTAILARILSPGDYGIVAMATVITGFAILFSDGGLSWATVQIEKISHNQVSNLFWLNTILGILITIILIFTSPLMASFYNELKVKWVACGLSINFIFSGITIQHQALARRLLKFNHLAINDIFSTIVSIASGIYMAKLGLGYWSLVGMTIFYSIAKMLGVWFIIPWIPSFPRKVSGTMRFINFGADILVFNFVNYFSRHLDNILIGMYCGANQLGFYEKAYNLLLFPINQINAPLTSVVVPSLSRLVNDGKSYNSYFINVFHITTCLICPIVFFFAVFSDQIVSIWLGNEWGPSSILFKYLSVAALLGAISNPIGWLLISSGMTKKFRYIGLINSIIIISSFVMGIKNQAEGIAVAYSIGMVPVFIFSWIYSTNKTSINLNDLIKPILVPLTSSVISIIISYYCYLIVEKYLIALISFFVIALIYFCLYLFIILFIFKRKEFFVNMINIAFKNGKFE